MLSDSLNIQTHTTDAQPRKRNISLSFFSREEPVGQKISPLKDSSVLDIVSHELGTPLHTLYESTNRLREIATRLRRVLKQKDLVIKITHFKTYLSYIDSSLQRLTTFIKTGQPADCRQNVREEKIFMDISTQAILLMRELEKPVADLQQVHDTFMKTDLANMPDQFNKLIHQLDADLDRMKSYLNDLTQLIPTQDLTSLKNNETTSTSAPPDVKIKLLIVEDNLINQKLLLKILKKRNYIVDVANNGMEGVSLFSPGKYDLVFMDLQMPVMDGYEAAREMRNMEYKSFSPSTPIITLTANAATPENKEKARDAGMNDFLSKPYRNTDIYRLIKKHSSKEVPSPTGEELDSPPCSPQPSHTKIISEVFQLLPILGVMKVTSQSPVLHGNEKNHQTFVMPT